jgi:hypothetical protein
MGRYSPSRHWLIAGLVALASAAFSVWCGLAWAWAMIPALLLLASAGVLLFLASRPPIQVHETHLVIGRRAIPWLDIRRLDHTGWISPLAVRITLFNDKRVWLVYAGDPDSAKGLLRQLRRMARQALIDGVPHRRFWGTPAASGDRKPLPSPKGRVLSPEDEAEVERLYQRLKAVGHLDPRNSPDEE